MSDAASTLGQRLKAERERRGMSTQKAADQMRLESWVVEALEAGDYVRIGPAVYAKGHLKKYASILGVSPLAEPASADAASAATPATPSVAGTTGAMGLTGLGAPAGVRMRAPSRSEPASWPWPRLAGCAVIAALVGGLLWWRPWHRTAGTSAGDAAAVAGAGAAADSPRPSAASPERTVEEYGSDAPLPDPMTAGGAAPAGAARLGEVPAVAVPASTASASAAPERAAPAGGATARPAAPASDATTPGAGPARLRLSFSADSWVDVRDAAGRRIYVGKGGANSVTTIGGMAPLKVYLGYAGGVQLEINSRAVAIGPQFVTGDVARFEAGADGVLRRESTATLTNGVPVRTTPPHD